MTLGSHQLFQDLLQKGKGSMTRMHSMIFPKIDQNKTLGQLIDAFAINTREVLEVFKRTSRTYGALLAFQLKMGHGFKANIEEMSKELPKEQDGRLVDLGAFKISALKCARQLLELVSANKSSIGPSMSNQTQALDYIVVILLLVETMSCHKTFYDCNKFCAGNVASVFLL
jgi:hypothetical protein